MKKQHKGDPYAAWAGAEERLQNATDTIFDLRNDLTQLRTERDALKTALWKSDPWKKNSDEGFTCMHCGHDYIYMSTTELPDEHHEHDCIWLQSRPTTEPQP